jgi:glycosyltransferase involved in cell wall biosynthesis
MKIAVFTKSTTLHKGHGGLETQNKALCEGLSKRGHKITVFSPKKELVFNAHEENGVKYVFVDAEYRNYILSPFNKNSWMKKSLIIFEQYHEKENFDLVLGQSSAAESIVENKFKLGVKTVSISHGTTLSEFNTFIKNISSLKDIYWLVRNTQYFLRQYFGRQRKFVLHSDRVIAVSEYVKKALVSETFVDEKKVEVVHNGVDGVPYTVEKKDRDIGGLVHIYFIGRIEKSKGILTIIDIVNEIDRDVVLHVIGAGPCQKEAEKMVAKYKIQEKVVFHGKMPHSDFIKKVHPDIFVFPTKRVEGFPMVIVEAMFAEMPVVAFNWGGVPDAIEDERTGFLIKADDNEDFKEKLVKLIDNADLRKEFGKNSKEKAEKEFTVDKMIEKYEKVFEEILK